MQSSVALFFGLSKQDFVQYIEKVLFSVMDEGAFMTPKIAKKVFNFFQVKKNHLENLTERETQVAHGIIDGLSYKLVADWLGISIDTVRMNIRNIYKKMNIHSKSELISYVVGQQYKNR